MKFKTKINIGISIISISGALLMILNSNWQTALGVFLFIWANNLRELKRRTL